LRYERCTLPLVRGRRERSERGGRSHRRFHHSDSNFSMDPAGFDRVEEGGVICVVLPRVC
jgi:hypothetical protein